MPISDYFRQYEVSRDLKPCICPGCMRERKGTLIREGKVSPFCDKFCEELYRKYSWRKDGLHLPWRRKRDIHFGNEHVPIVKIGTTETAQYDPYNRG